MKNLIKLLKELKSIGITAVKQSLEDEGAGFEDIMHMRKITKKSKLKLNVKIGGCEAKNDIFFCQSIGVDGIVAPMVESSYALKKFIQTVSNNYKSDLYINLESKKSFNNLNEIIQTKQFKKLKGVVVGRSDLAGSLGLSKSEVNSKKIYNIVNKSLKKIKKYKKLVKMGGSVTHKSRDFIYKLFTNKLIHRVETRNLEINLNIKNIDNLENLIKKIFLFEMNWLKYKNSNFKKNKFLKQDNIRRIKELKKRLR